MYKTITKILVETALDKWRQLMSVMSLSGGKNKYSRFFIFSCSKVNFLLGNDKTLITIYIAKKKFIFEQNKMEKQLY